MSALPGTSSTATPPAQLVDITAMWALLWSQSQNAFHVERLMHTFEANRNAFADDRRSDYVLLEVGSRQAVDAAADGLRSICHCRERCRSGRVGSLHTSSSKPSA